MHKLNNHAASTCACRDSFIHHSSLPFLARRGIHHEWDEYLDAVYGRDDDASRYPSISRPLRGFIAAIAE